MKHPSELEQEITLRVLRGVNLLDAVQPGWWQHIDPSTLVIKDRGACVFAQATPSFIDGITSVAERATSLKIAVQCLYGAHRKRLSGWKDPFWYLKDPRPVIDVFYYGFDVDPELKALAPHGSRKAAWKALSAEWVNVVTERQQ